MSQLDPPPRWEPDEITKFFDNARANAYATFVHLKQEYQWLADIDEPIRELV
jgi:hypothetical protein